MPNKVKVILVEDNEDERFFMKEGLTASGLFEIIGEAMNGDELLALFENATGLAPQLILTDLNMPGKNGYDVLREAHERPELSHSCVIVLSSAPSVPFAERCKKLGACAYFTKPDTFLEYEVFAKTIYEEVKHSCNKH
jgi:CheY-like chemotaxis protein